MNWKKKMQDVVDVSAEGTTSIVGGIVEGLFGQFVPGLTTIYFSLKQKRFEKNMKRFQEEVKAREAEIKEKLEEKISKEEFEKIVEIILDYVGIESQEDKIKFIVNGLVNLAGHEEAKEDFVLLFYDTLRDMRLVDIAVLRFYYDLDTSLDQGNRKSFLNLIEELGITEQQYDAIKEKLSRMGLLQTKRDKEMDRLYQNVMEIESYLEKLSKGKKARLSTKKLPKVNSYSITKFGRDFVRFFTENYSDDESKK